MNPSLVALLAVLKAIVFYGIFAKETQEAVAAWIVTLNGTDPADALRGVTSDDVAEMAGHHECCASSDDHAAGKIFPGDGTALKALLAALQQFLPYILPLIIPKA